jgi:L-alanine-DL-glutamate epimerase-like enolase superfamily enzyme
MPTAPVVTRVCARAFSFPTDAPEADGTISWSTTTMIIVEVESGSVTGIGYSYASATAAHLINDVFSGIIFGELATDIPRHWVAMVGAVRNVGRPGIASCAISAVDVALWDLKAKLLGVPLAILMGKARNAVPIYGSGGFTSYSNEQLQHQLGGWVERDGCHFVKMKIGAEPNNDPGRVRAARAAIGDGELFVDANGACPRKQALQLAQRFADLGVTWFEEPVSSDDLEGLRLLRDRAPAQMEIAAGEYGYTPHYFRRMLEAGAVDVLQADATRCGGYTGFLRAAALADAFGIPFSAHTAPALHLPVCCAAPRLRHIEWFHDHVRIERMVFDGAPLPKDGMIAPDLSRPGHGLEFKQREAERLAA